MEIIEMCSADGLCDTCKLVCWWILQLRHTIGQWTSCSLTRDLLCYLTERGLWCTTPNCII